VGLAGIDIDFVEICKRCQKPIAFIELVRDTGFNRVGITSKNDMVTSYVARYMGRPSFILFYVPNEDSTSILAVRVLQTRPERGSVVGMTPEQWADYLRYIQNDHKLICSKAPKKVTKTKESEVRMFRKQEDDAGFAPRAYSEDEVILLAGMMADIVMERKLGDDAGNVAYDALRNNIAEDFESIIRVGVPPTDDETFELWESGKIHTGFPLRVELAERLLTRGSELLGGVVIS